MTSDDSGYEINHSVEPETNYSIQWSDDFSQPSVAIIYAVSAYTNSEPNCLDPLYQSIDLELLDRLFKKSNGIQVSFLWGGRKIEVTPDKIIIED